MFLSSNEVQATMTSNLLEQYNHEHNSKKNKHSGAFSNVNKSLDNNRKKKKYHTSVDDKNYIDRFSSSSEYKNLLMRLSVKKDSNKIYKKLFEEEEFKNRKKKIKDNEIMISVVNDYLKKKIEEYNKMVKQDKKLNIPAHITKVNL